ncbi:hypothetical protein JZO82_12555 [Vagococcus fluvialis]|uniref:hypothetical protein n=1 Tax=Vagococcus fluvialis TaxID=2738 RepID=UPI001A8FDA17|nr:hypothetical protein [Vagococcus fluvialis]MBO0429998.1 hypothetical protein [Vagococcus fluvialis]
MKLKMMDENVCLGLNRFYSKLFEKNNLEIENDLSLKFKRKPSLIENKEAIVYSKENKKSDRLTYRKIKLNSEWQDGLEWLLFFWKLGEFIENYGTDISIFISYISVEIPALLMSTSIIDTRYRKFQDKKLESDIFNFFKPGDKISYLVGIKDNKWHDAEVVKVKYEEGKKEEFNPYLFIKIKGLKKEGTQHIQVPRNLWQTKIRKGGKIKGVGGRGTRVRLTDVISEKISERYGEETFERLRVTPRCHVNLVGRRIDKFYRDMRESIQFSDDLGSFLLTDLIYFDNDDESNFINVHVVSSEKTDVKVDTDTISIFVGSKSALDFGESIANKNIYLTSREKVNLVEDNNILINNLRQKTIFTNEEKKKKEEEIKWYLKNEGVEIPRGVEISVF